jgi:hypothetical protein
VPRFERPQRRVILVSNPLSSMKISFAGSRPGILSRHAARALAMSSRDCSAATSAFFLRVIP